MTREQAALAERRAVRTETFEWTGPANGARIETGMSGMAYLSGLRDGVVPSPPLSLLATAELVETNPGSVQLICSAPDTQYGLFRELDPGTASLLLHTAVGCAARSIMGLDHGWATTTCETAYGRPISPRAGALTAIAEVVELSAGRVLVNGELADDCGRIVMTISSTLDVFEL
jgi:acyl-coenzyme A thioesterase PaaI-like protein